MLNDEFGPLQGVDRGSTWSGLANLVNRTASSLNLKGGDADANRLQRQAAEEQAAANRLNQIREQGMLATGMLDTDRQLIPQMVMNGQGQESLGYAQDQAFGQGQGQAPLTPEQMAGMTTDFVRDPSFPMNDDARKATNKQQMQGQKDQQRQEDDFAKKVREYMTKREGIALDTQNRMDKLDSMYANQGTDYTGLMQLADRIKKYTDPSGRMGVNENQSMGLAKQYAAGRMSEQQLMELKQKLAMQQDTQYGSMTDDAANMLRMDMMSKQYEGNKLREKLGLSKLEGKDEVKLSGETKNKIGLINSATKGIDDMFTLLSTGKGDAALTDPFLASEYTVAKQTILDNFAHLQTGAAISTEESKLYKSLIPQYRDSKDVKIMKLRKMRELLEGRHNMYTTGDVSMPDKPVIGSSSIEDKRARAKALAAARS